MLPRRNWQMGGLWRLCRRIFCLLGCSLSVSAHLPAQSLSETVVAGAAAGSVASALSQDTADTLKNRASNLKTNSESEVSVGTREIILDGANDGDPGANDDSGSWQSTDRIKEIEMSAMVKIDEIIENSGDYHYAAFGAPNPFARPESIVSGLANKDSEDVSINGVEIPMVSSLQRFPLNNLRLNGIWQLDNGERRALILTPENEGVIIKINDPIAAGKVIAIEDKKIKTRQFSIRNDGVREYSEVDIYIASYKDKPSGKIILEPGEAARLQLQDNNTVREKKSGSLIPSLPANLDNGLISDFGQSGGLQNEMIPVMPDSMMGSPLAPAKPSFRSPPPLPGSDGLIPQKVPED